MFEDKPTRDADAKIAEALRAASLERLVHTDRLISTRRVQAEQRNRGAAWMSETMPLSASPETTMPLKDGESTFTSTRPGGKLVPLHEHALVSPPDTAPELLAEAQKLMPSRSPRSEKRDARLGRNWFESYAPLIAASTPPPAIPPPLQFTASPAEKRMQRAIDAEKSGVRGKKIHQLYTRQQ